MTWLWLISTTLIGYFLGLILNVEQPELASFMGFCVGFAAFFVLNTQHSNNETALDSAPLAQ